MSESAIYLNLNLHIRSINLEDPSRMDVDEFGAIVRHDLKHEEKMAKDRVEQKRRKESSMD